MVLNYHIGRLVLSSLCVGDLVRLVLGGVRFAGSCLQNEHLQTPVLVIISVQLIPSNVARSDHVGGK